jgi:hypothetical protein
VKPDFLWGIDGRISMAQYRQIQQVLGVQVAAPIAMVGYAQLGAAMFEPVPAAALAGSGRQLYRISTTWVSDDGASRVTQPPSYLYVTPRPVTPPDGEPVTDGASLTRLSHNRPGFSSLSPTNCSATGESACGQISPDDAVSSRLSQALRSKRYRD